MTDEKGWKEFSVLLDRIQELETNLDATLRQLEEKQQNEDRFKCELLTKDQVIRLMEKDYDGLTTQIQTLQHVSKDHCVPCYAPYKVSLPSMGNEMQNQIRSCFTNIPPSLFFICHVRWSIKAKLNNSTLLLLLMKLHLRRRVNSSAIKAA